MARVMIVSADGHIGAPTAAYRPYFEHGYLDAYDEWAVFHADQTEQRVARKMEKHLVHPTNRPSPNTEQICDPTTRLAILDGEGVTAEVLFPVPDFTDEHPVPFQVTIGADPDRQDLELEAAGNRAYNRWLAEYCDATAPRSIGLANVSCYDIEGAVREVRWAKDAGLRGVHIAEADARLPHRWDEYYEPLWSACAESALLGESGATEGELRAVVGRTAARVYDLDTELLQPIVERVGPTVDELLQPPPTDLDPAIVNQGALRMA